MLQIYFISVIANLIGGLCLILRKSEFENKLAVTLRTIFANKPIQGVVGTVAFVAGFLKFFIFVPQVHAPVIIEDLLPALTGLLIGAGLIMNVLSKEVSKTENVGQELTSVQSKLQKFHIPMGIIGMAVAVAHFIFPAAVLL
jgi:hypothetical protein